MLLSHGNNSLNLCCLSTTINVTILKQLMYLDQYYCGSVALFGNVNAYSVIFSYNMQTSKLKVCS